VRPFGTLAALATIALAVCMLTGRAQSRRVNIARGRTYTLTPSPNYRLTTDPGDARQLTDSVYADRQPIWLAPSTVGWQYAAPVTIVIDLERPQPIAGISFDTAAGRADVEWPRSIFVLTSDDGRQFFPVGDLVAMSSRRPPASGYARLRYVTESLRTHGRYVALIVDPTGPYVFCDEIEVLGGDEAWLNEPRAAEPVTDLRAFFVGAHMRVSVDRRLSVDLQAARAALAASRVDGAARATLSRELDEVAAGLVDVRVPPPDMLAAILPLNDLHARMFAVRGSIAQAEGALPLTAWAVDPWALGSPTERPPSFRERAVSIAAMNGETRAGAVNVANATGRDMALTVRLDGLPVDERAPDIRLFEVVWTDTRELTPVADALNPLAGPAGTFTLRAGMTRQIWISVTLRGRVVGRLQGSLELTGGGIGRVTVPIEIEVLPGEFPAAPSLHVGGWDYTDGDSANGLTAGNVAPLVEALRALGVDSPWAQAHTLGPGRFDGSGRLVEPPDTTRFDRWIERWPGANRYYVFISGADTLGNVRTSESARFEHAVQEWLRFWTSHAAARGVAASKLMLLIADEPHAPADDDRIIVWGRAIRKAASGVGIWEDPNHRDPASAKPEALDLSDVLALKRALMVEQRRSYVDFYRRRLRPHQSLAVYGASGPVRLLDPYTYHRLQAWVAADLGATSSFFWSFSDDARGRSWNEYATLDAPYSPFFLGADRVAASKHSEAIREGAEDFEYLTRLRHVAAERTARSDASGRALAALLEKALDAVVRMPAADDFRWTSAKDHGAADRLRIEIAAALSSK